MTTKAFLEQREKLLERLDKAVDDMSLAYIQVGKQKEQEDITKAIENVSIYVLEYSNALSDLIQFYEKEIELIKEDTKTREHTN